MFVKQATGLKHWKTWEHKPKHLAPILRKRFKAICNKYESNEITIRLGHPIF